MSFKTGFFIILAFLAITNLVWFYVFINQSVTYDHTNQESKHLVEDLNLMRSLMVDLSGLSNKESIIMQLNKKYAEHILKEEDGAFFIDNIGLKFKNNKLAEIIFMNEP